MSGKQIVIVEDEPDILEVLSYNLKREGFSVKTSLDGVSALELIQHLMPDLVLLDLMLPGLDGLEICRRLKNAHRTQHIPIIMVTAKGEESDIVLGLGIGADDYISKPFSPSEFVARVKAVLRRGDALKALPQKDCVTIDSLEIDADKFKVSLKGQELKFTATEFRILHHLACNPGRVFTRDQLMSHALGSHAIVIERNIDVHIRAIRKKIDVYQQYIETIRGVGYRFKELD